MNGNVLFIGSSGRVGRIVLRAWYAESDLNIFAQYRRKGANVRQMDLIWDIAQDLEPAQRWIEQNGPVSTFIIFAGVTPATGSEMDDNVAIAEAYLKAAYTLGVRRVLLASSSAVYGSATSAIISETHECKPLNAYGTSKLSMEQSAYRFRQIGMEVCCLRIGNVAGADALLLNAQNVNTNVPLTIDIFPDGLGPLRSYIGPASFAQILEKLANHETELPFLLNVAAPEPVYMDTLAEAAKLPWNSNIPRVDTPQRIVLDCARLADLVPLTSSMGAAATLISEWRKYK